MEHCPCFGKREREGHEWSNRSVQNKQCTNLNTFLWQFKTVEFGHGASWKECLTHETKKALVQTIKGLVSLCKHLLTHAKFNYVLLRETQSEFSVYRQSTGSHAFMTSSDVFFSMQATLSSTCCIISWVTGISKGVEETHLHGPYDYWWWSCYIK